MFCYEHSSLIGGDVRRPHLCSLSYYEPQCPGAGATPELADTMQAWTHLYASSDVVMKILVAG